MILPPSRIFVWGVAFCAFLITVNEAAKRYEHGEKCFPSEDWCNYGKWMWCRKGQCQCLHTHRQIYDQGRDRCVGLVGKECNAYIGDRDCVSNAFCAFVSGKSFCQCKDGYISTPKNTCISISGEENSVEPENVNVKVLTTEPTKPPVERVTIPLPPLEENPTPIRSYDDALAFSRLLQTLFPSLRRLRYYRYPYY